MFEIDSDRLVASFPEMRHGPRLVIDFKRTLRIPDDGRSYPLPPGLGSFPLRHIDDYAEQVPRTWFNRGGVLLPMWQSEAMWIHFAPNHVEERGAKYPFAIKVATGKISAITGEGWQKGLDRNPQDYLVAPQQPWLDGYCVEKGVIRQFVAMPLGDGYSVEEQLTGEAEFGGIQIEVFPMRTEHFEKRFPKNIIRLGATSLAFETQLLSHLCESSAMGLSPGGRMRQEIYEDPYSIHEWDTEHSSRCFIHLLNSTTWQAITGQLPPSLPMNAEIYTKLGMPWFDYYDKDAVVLKGEDKLAQAKSVVSMAKGKGEKPLPDNASLTVSNIVNLRAGLKPGQVREASF